MNRVLSSAPSLLPEIETLNPDQMRERVTTMTAAELQTLVDELEKNDQAETSTVLQNPELLHALESRMRKQDVVESVRASWTKLRTQIEPQTLTDEAWNEAEKGFLKNLKERGGAFAWFGSAGLAILSLFGFTSARTLQNRIKEKGMLRTVIEHAKEHPIFTAMITAMGLKTGSAGYEYVRQNMPVIQSHVESIAGETGQDALTVARVAATKARDIMIQAKDTGIQTLVHGLSYGLGGTYDDETGVVTLENPLLGGQKTLRPPFMIAYQTSVRKNGGGALIKQAYSLFLIEKKFDALARQATYESNLHTQTQSALALSVHRGLELMKNGIRPDGDSPESRELKRIIDVALQTEPSLQQVKPLKSAPATRMETIAALTRKKRELEQFFVEQEAPSFKRTSDTIRSMAADAEKKLAAGDYKGSKETVKKNALSDIETEINRYNTVNQQKAWIASQLVQQLDTASMLEQGKWQLDNSAGGGKLLGGVLASTVQSAEKYGVSLMRSGPGKWVARSITGYSFLPIALEGAAMLQAGEKGAQAKQAFMLDAGEAVGGFIPGVGEVLDLKSAIMGTDLNGRELSSTERMIAGSLGVLGSASIAAGFFTGGVSIVGFRALRGALAARKARKMYNAAKVGIEISGMSNAAVRTLKKSAKAAEKLEKMQNITALQAKARKVQGFIHSAQRTVQIATYAHLGWQLCSGISTIATNIDGTITSANERLAAGIEQVDTFLAGSSSPTSS